MIMTSNLLLGDGNKRIILDTIIVFDAVLQSGSPQNEQFSSVSNSVCSKNISLIMISVDVLSVRSR